MKSVMSYKEIVSWWRLVKWNIQLSHQGKGLDQDRNISLSFLRMITCNQEFLSFMLNAWAAQFSGRIAIVIKRPLL